MSKEGWWEGVVEKMNSYHSLDPQNLPGAAFGVETLQDGRLISSVGEGWSDNSICAIASMAKPFVATAVLMALEENDQLDIERPVHELPGMELYKHDEVKRRIRVRHLLQHTSGLPGFRHYSKSARTICNDGHSKPGCKDEELELGPQSAWVGDPGQTNECVEVEGGGCRPARAARLEEVSGHVMKNYEPEREPGQEYGFSCMNYIVGARIVEQVTGKSVNRYLKEKVFEGVGMKDSFFIAQGTGDEEMDRWMEEGVTQSQRDRIPDVKLLTREGEYPPEMAPGAGGCWDKFRKGWRYVYPDGGMYSTVEDLLKYLAMLRDGGVSEGKRILSEEIVKLMVEDQGFGHTMGLGYRQDTSPYGQGAGTLEHLGRFMTYFWFDNRPGDPVLGVFLSQRLTYMNVRAKSGVGMKIIYSHFVALVQGRVLGFHPLGAA